MTSTADECGRVLAYLYQMYRKNQEAQVHALELERELGLPTDVVKQCLDYLSREGLVETDLFPVNVWASLTDEGARIAEGADVPPASEDTS